MSILVRGMDMPKECRVCPLQGYHERTGKTWCKPADEILAENYKPIPFDGRPDWCPLVEVKTPHGRLIDADELKKEFPHDTDWEYPVNTNGYFCESIDDMPTVIDAEGETWGST